MDQAVKAGIRIFRTWGFGDINATYIPDGVSGKSSPSLVFAKSKLNAIAAPSV